MTSEKPKPTMDCYGIGFWTYHLQFFVLFCLNLYLRLLEALQELYCNIATFSQLNEDLFELAATFCDASKRNPLPCFPGVLATDDAGVPAN